MTVCLGLVIVALFASPFLIVSYFFIATNYIIIIVASFECLFLAIYIVIETQMIVGNQAGFQYSIDDYILASLGLYVNIVMFFVQILAITGASSR